MSDPALKQFDWTESNEARAEPEEGFNIPPEAKLPPPQFTKEQQAEIAKKSTTALITGVLSLILGVGYVLITFWLDPRSSQLVPPPPEAFEVF